MVRFRGRWTVLKGSSSWFQIHHSTVEVNNHKGANIAGSLAGSVFYKPKMTTQLSGLHARTVLHNAPTIYVHQQGESDPGGESADSNTATWVLVRAALTKDHRVFAKVQLTYRKCEAYGWSGGGYDGDDAGRMVEADSKGSA
jgi:hypothetical protein